MRRRPRTSSSRAPRSRIRCLACRVRTIGTTVTARPDSAFAVVEAAPDGRKVRHLPHHDETGAVDRAHLRAARSRLGQVRWLDPASEAIARQHLEKYWRELGR